MRRIFLMSSVLFVAPFVFGESGEVSAQCVATQDCASLGYTEASCPNGGIKCPFGNTWNCKGDGCGTSYKYTCTGANQIKPISGACGGKYTSCKCASGYEWKNGTCSKALPKCQIGDIYYTDNTCSYRLDSTKTVKGVVVYVKPSGGGYAVETAIWPTNINSHLMETIYYDDMPKLSLAQAKKDFTAYPPLGIPAGAAQSIIDNATEIGYALMKAGANFNDSNAIWNRMIATSTAVDSITSGGEKAIWSFRFRSTSWDVNGTVSGFETDPLGPLPIEYFDNGRINVWQGFEF